MINLSDKNLMDVKSNWSKSEQKLFENWEKLVKEYNYIKLYGMLGSDCREAWDSCLKIQEEIFSICGESGQKAFLDLQANIVEDHRNRVYGANVHDDQLV